MIEEYTISVTMSSAWSQSVNVSRPSTVLPWPLTSTQSKFVLDKMDERYSVVSSNIGEDIQAAWRKISVGFVASRLGTHLQ